MNVWAATTDWHEHKQKTPTMNVERIRQFKSNQTTLLCAPWRQETSRVEQVLTSLSYLSLYLLRYQQPTTGNKRQRSASAYCQKNLERVHKWSIDEQRIEALRYHSSLRQIPVKRNILYGAPRVLPLTLSDTIDPKHIYIVHTDDLASWQLLMKRLAPNNRCFGYYVI